MKTLLSVLFTCFITLGFSQNLSVKIENYEAKDGYFYIAVFDSQEAFEKRETPHKLRISASEIKNPIVFKGLKKGTYCVSVFHDVNGNKKLDTKDSGIPKEPYGFSNNPGLGKPNFDKMSFELVKDHLVIIEMRSVKSTN